MASAPPAAPPAAVPPTDAVFRIQQDKVASYTPQHLAEKILTSRAALEGERKAVTVLFADVAGFTATASRLLPEDLHAVMDGCFERLSQAVHRFEGTINQFTGDGIMALFGAPIAHEDHAERAVHAALAIQTAIAEYGATLAREKGIEFRMRIGVHSGTVVVGRIGDNLRMDYTAQGDTVNLAARIEEACRPGSVLVSDATRRLAEGAFTFRALPPFPVKGKEASVTAFEVLGRRGRRARVELAAEQGLTPLVGRERELSRLREAFERAQEGHGQVVGVVGEAGVGKSRLLYEFRRELGQSRAIYLEGRCISWGQPIDSHLWKWTMRVHLSFARLALLEGDLETAFAQVEDGLRVAERTESRKYVTVGRRLRGEILLAGGRVPEGLAELRGALTVAEAVACPRVIWEAAGALGRALVGVGREDETRRVYESALEALSGTLPRIPDARLQETLLASEPVARLRDEARTLGVTS